MSETNSPRKKAVKTGLGLAAGAALAVVCPPAAVGAAAAVFLSSARKFAQSGDPKDAQGMVTGYSDLSSTSDD